ncbi:response regulator transcription factor [Candidatus Chloroploca sp. Khr17]|uniref:response regulator transcription factor n=1 Tax=Candidatus Chloroploca sp. Khr17 TaxID=2496869 RepID=UPI00101CAB4B|nr:response regulator transcription factor [Candidatus Chloroploca sp. Khr17]
MRILIASGELMQAKMTRFLLEEVGYSVEHAANAYQAEHILDRGSIDLILLDEHCPDIGGASLCQKLRSQYHIPIIYTAENCPVAERVMALKMGADDVLPTPYNPHELLARIEAVMRRYGDESIRLFSTYQPISVGQLRLDPVQRRVVIGDNREELLTEREFQLLYYLVQNARCVLSSRQLLQKIWGMEDITESNLVPVYIGRLRRKIEPNPVKPKHIVRVRDLGYSYHP